MDSLILTHPPTLTDAYAHVLEPLQTQSAAASASTTYNQLESEISDTRSIAIAGLVIAVIGFVLMPVVSWLIARRQARRQMMTKAAMLGDTFSRRTSVASNGHIMGSSSNPPQV